MQREYLFLILFIFVSFFFLPIYSVKAITNITIQFVNYQCDYYILTAPYIIVKSGKYCVVSNLLLLDPVNPVIEINGNNLDVTIVGFNHIIKNQATHGVGIRIKGENNSIKIFNLTVISNYGINIEAYRSFIYIKNCKIKSGLHEGIILTGNSNIIKLDNLSVTSNLAAIEVSGNKNKIEVINSFVYGEYGIAITGKNNHVSIVGGFSGGKKYGLAVIHLLHLSARTENIKYYIKQYNNTIEARWANFCSGDLDIYNEDPYTEIVLEETMFDEIGPISPQVKIKSQIYHCNGTIFELPGINETQSNEESSTNNIANIYNGSSEDKENETFSLIIPKEIIIIYQVLFKVFFGIDISEKEVEDLIVSYLSFQLSLFRDEKIKEVLIILYYSQLQMIKYIFQKLEIK